MFWIPNINTYLDNNYAVGSRICYWILPHNTWFGFETSGTRVRLGFIQKKYTLYRYNLYGMKRFSHCSSSSE